jgi:hypothetical protein
MSAILREGVELGRGVNYLSLLSSNINSTEQKSGDYCVVLPQESNGTPNLTLFTWLNLPTDINEFYFKGDFKINDFNIDSGLGLYNVILVAHVWTGSATEAFANIRINLTSHKLELYTGTYTSSDLKATGSTVIEADTYYRLEFHGKVDDTTGILEFMLDGNLEGSWEGDTQPGSSTTTYGLSLYSTGGFLDGGQETFWDNLGVNDINGSKNNSWIGDTIILSAIPNNNGDVTQMNGSDGNQVDNYLLVDEIPDDADSTYVSTSSLNFRDLYNISIPSAPSNFVIETVQVFSRTRRTGGTATDFCVIVKPGGETAVPFGRPISTISSGGWSAVNEATLHEATDETTQNGDTDYAEAGVDDTTMELLLNEITDPETDSNHVVRFYANSVSGGSPEKMTVGLYQGNTLIATVLNNGTLTRDAYTLYSYTLTTGEASSITDYSDLRVRFTIDSGVTGSDSIRVTQVEMQVPEISLGEYEGPIFSLPTPTGYSSIHGTLYENNPATNQTWSDAEMGGLQIGPKNKEALGTRTTSIIVQVEYKVGPIPKFYPLLVNQIM